jgi:GNAT superfamily N-acetyltransferase
MTSEHPRSVSRSDYLNMYNDQMRRPRAAMVPGDFVEDGPVIRFFQEHSDVVVGLPDLGLRGKELTDLIARQRNFDPDAQTVTWRTWRPDRPLELTVELVDAGFVAERSYDLYFGLAQEVAAHNKDLPDKVSARQVTDSVDIQRVVDMLVGMGEAEPSLGPDLSQRVERNGTVVLAAEAEGEPVAAAWLEWTEGTEFAGLWGAGTVSRWRNQGIQSSLIARRAEIAAARGVKYLYTETCSDGSRRNLRRTKFTFGTITTAYVWTPSG